jgi:predicted negative regulator of RcsB-dependent stress response
VAEIRIEEKKRGAPWVLILLLIIIAAVIGWWLWSHRADSAATPANTPSGAVADSTGAARTP